jgi:hypothetical protein
MAAKKSAKKAPAKKASAKKAAAKKAPAKKTAGLVKCGKWQAWLDLMPGPGATPTLHVTGECTTPTTGYKITLVPAVPQGINPKILLLKKVVKKPSGIVLPVVTKVPVHYIKKKSPRYTAVTILPDGVTVKVKIVT